MRLGLGLASLRLSLLTFCLGSWAIGSSVGAQEDAPSAGQEPENTSDTSDGETAPAAPEAPSTPALTTDTPATQLTVPAPPPAGPAVLPAPPVGPTVPPPIVPTLDEVLEPLLRAAEADLSSGRIAVAYGRAALVAQHLPQGVPLRVRADGLALLAQRRANDQTPPVPAAEELLVPLVEQAVIDLQNRRPDYAAPRLDFVLARVSAQSVLGRRAAQLRSTAGAGTVAPPPVATTVPQVGTRLRSDRDPNRAGTGELIELYITAGAMGGLTGFYIPFAASDGGRSDPGPAVYTLTMIGGTALFAASVLIADLSLQFRTGIPPTISAATRIGFVAGMFAMGMSVAEGSDGVLPATLVWGGGMAGAVAGVAIGFGTHPSVADARLVESTALWGGALLTYAAMMTNYDDEVLGHALSLGGLGTGTMIGIILAALEGEIPLRRTLWLDLGFIAGSAIAAAIPILYFDNAGESYDSRAIGIAMTIGAAVGWGVTFAITEVIFGSSGASESDVASSTRFAVVPIEGGATFQVVGEL